MNKILIAKAMVVALKSYGIEIDNMDDSADILKLYISVPKTADRLNVDGKQMAGHHLGKRVKNLLSCHIPNVKVFYKIRDDHWSKEQEKLTQETTLKDVNNFNFTY